MLKKVLSTDDSYSLLFLRLLLATVFFPHGAQKVLGWHGGPGFSKAMDMFTANGIPAALAFLAIMAESAGVIALLAGLFTRVAAFALGVNMVVCAAAAHVKNGFFMNWMGNQKGEGYEFHILVVAICLALTISGAGKWSVDRRLTANKRW